MTPAGGFTLSSNLAFTIPAAGDVISQYVVPVQPSFSSSYTAGTGANQINKGATKGGSAAASPASIDLTTIVCVDASVGFSHLRELLVANLATVAARDLLLDMTVSNAFMAFCSIATKITIPAGSYVKFHRPLDTAGWTVDGTHKIISLDPGANTIAYQVVALGD